MFRSTSAPSWTWAWDFRCTSSHEGRTGQSTPLRTRGPTLARPEAEARIRKGNRRSKEKSSEESTLDNHKIQAQTLKRDSSLVTGRILFSLADSNNQRNIELLWDYWHILMDRYEICGSSKEEFDRMKDICRQEWIKATKNGKAMQLCDGFRGKLELCIAAGGDSVTDLWSIHIHAHPGKPSPSASIAYSINIYYTNHILTQSLFFP